MWSRIKEHFFSKFSTVTAWYMPIFVASDIPGNKIWHFTFAETKTNASVFSLKLISTLIKYTVIGWVPSFTLLEIVAQKDCLSWFIWVLKVSLRLTLIQKGGLCPFGLFPLMTEFSEFMPLQDITPGSNWLGGVSLKDYEIIWKTKMKERKTKWYLETLIVLWMKWKGMVETKHRLYRCCFNYALSKLIEDNGLENLWRRENLEFIRYDRSSGTKSRIDRVYSDIKIASNIKINHIMVSFSDHYNAIFIY